MEGQKFGRWTVINYTWKKTPCRGTIWECRCDCGTLREVTLKTLKNEKKPRSCGCIRKENSRKLFESNYEKTEGCWIWKGCINQGGYGKIGEKDLAHRRAYQYKYGQIPPGKQVCHKCDNRLCVNPSHLFLGSIGDNMRDRTSKNRQAKGSRIGSSILTEDQVLRIRQLRLQEWAYQRISDELNVKWRTIQYICKNKAWKHVPLGEECKAYRCKAWGYPGPKRNSLPINIPPVNLILA